MKTPETSQQPNQPVPPRHAPFSRRRGVALILAISFIVLLSALIVGFFSRVNTDLAGARSYSEGVNVRQLADSAVGVVMGQIRAATTVKNGCWASQPGMIRVYGTANGQANAQAYAFYKLYSSHNLVVSGSDIQDFNPAQTSPGSGAKAEVPLGTGGWASQPAFFTDLNEPVDVPDPSAGAGTKATIKRYPIIDPSVARIPARNQHTNNNSPGLIEGLEVNLPVQELNRSNAPMPVRWMYVLRDGTLTAPTPLNVPATGPTGLRATWAATGTDGSASGVPTKDNPIVGRIAFWTDDDTCKVNINTAGGYLLPSGMSEDSNLDNSKPSGTVPERNPAFFAGSFWDTPRIQTYFDRGFSGPPDIFRGGLANAQPVRNEYQRYPGHPSTTSLGLVFKNLLQGGGGFDSEKLYKMTPRLIQGASQGGTRQLLQYDAEVDTTVFGIVADPPASIKKTFDPTKNYNDPKKPGDGDRFSYHLFGSVDELLYTTQNIAGQSGSRNLAEKIIGLGSNQLTASKIDQVRSCLTTHSRAPELNLFGRPRVTIWPMSSPQSEGQLVNLGIRNPTDDLIRFCSTVGRNPNPNTQRTTRQGEFVFDRDDPYSSTADFNRPRNQQVFQYLQSVTSNNQGRIPGWGTSFEGKYASAPGGRSQILAEIFDYIRSVNLKDTSRDQQIDAKYGRTDPSTQPTVPTAEARKADARYAKRGIVVPTRIPAQNISGFGRFPTASEVSLVFYHGGYIWKPKSGRKEDEDVEYDWWLLDSRNTAANSAWQEKNEITGALIRAFLIVETFNPMQGYGPVTNLSTGAGERITYEITSLTGFKIKTPSMSAPQSLGLGIGKNNVWRSSGSTYGGRNFGGTEGFFHTMQDKVGNLPPENPARPPYPWGSGPVTYEKAFISGSATGAINAPSSNLSGNGPAYYPFQTPCKNKFDGIRVGVNPETGETEKEFDFTGGQMEMEIRYSDNAQNPLPAHNELIQKLVLQWPDGRAWPVPITEREAKNKGEGFRQDPGGLDHRFVPVSPQPAENWNSNDGTADFISQAYNPPRQLIEKWSTRGGFRIPYHLPLRIWWAAGFSDPRWREFNTDNKKVGNNKNYRNRFLQILQPGDTIRSLVPGGADPAATDPRVVALQQTVASFKPHPDYNKSTNEPNLKRRAQTLRLGHGGFYFDPDKAREGPHWFPDWPATNAKTGLLTANVKYAGISGPDLPRGVTATRTDGKAADFDTGIGNFPDGAYGGKADEGNISRSWLDEWGIWHYVEPYFSTWTYDAPGDTYFSPNRQIPSPVMFGSLLAPQTSWDRAGWKTLLFCPSPAGENHPGALSPPDHLWLDLFSMPVVEPYAISEPFSTDGKVNLNYRMMPFGYLEASSKNVGIHRSTALRAALHPLRVTAIPRNFTNANGQLKHKTRLTTKQVTINGVPTTKDVDNPENLRYLVDRDETLKGFDAFFDEFETNRSRGFFKSATQICERFLYPKGRVFGGSTIRFQPGEAEIKQWWANNNVTGDNLREKPYADLYSRVTTKSNTYTIHYRVQTLRQRPFTGGTGGEAAYYQTWDEGRDQVLSEFRGHTTIERYLDPEDPRFQSNYSPASEKINVETDSLETAYRFRIIYNKRFSPW